MKKKSIGLVILMSLFVMISCGDDNADTPPVVSNKTLAVADTVCMMFKSINGSSEGGKDGVEMGKYRERHNIRMNDLLFDFNERVKNSSITFIGDTDSVKINGYINCSYVESGSNLLTGIKSAHDKVFKYKFEDDKLKILFNPDKDNWVVLGYGNKDKIEVYIETKYFQVGAMPINPDRIIPEIEDKYVWEIDGTFSFDANISITPLEAEKIVERKNWQDFFDEIVANWKYIPAGEYYAYLFKTSLDLKHQYQGASWSVYKMTYLPKTTDN